LKATGVHAGTLVVGTSDVGGGGGGGVETAKEERRATTTTRRRGSAVLPANILTLVGERKRNILGGGGGIAINFNGVFKRVFCLGETERTCQKGLWVGEVGGFVHARKGS
jgi:hypothetical protein